MQLSDNRPVPAHGLAAGRSGAKPDLICLSHLRWDFVWQRPQHLMSRFARDRRVFFVEEPIFEPTEPRLEVSERKLPLPRHGGEGKGEGGWDQPGIKVAVPYLPHGLSPEQADAAQAELLREMLEQHEIAEYILWYYTPMAIPCTEGLEPLGVVYDCMDELSLFRGAPLPLLEREAKLLAAADLVFTGGQSLYEAKRERHPRVHPFPSSIEAEHFRQAREECAEPADQAALPRPRLGYFGVIDERLDLDLVAAVADARPDWQVVMVGPVVKIDLESLPRRANLHYLGMKGYADLPLYLAGWDVALMPFAQNESTRFISPTKTPEYLAGGRPVVSTPIRDVVKPYGEEGLVEIADAANTPEEFVAAIERALSGYGEGWLDRVDEFLSHGSWSRTWREMSDLIDAAVATRREGPRRDLPVL